MRSGLLDPSGFDIDVAALHKAYLTHAKRRGVMFESGAEAQTIERKGTAWLVNTSKAQYVAPLFINAAGAWGDVIAQKAGVRPIGLQPMRRTVLTLPPPDDYSWRHGLW